MEEENQKKKIIENLEISNENFIETKKHIGILKRDSDRAD